MSQAPDTYFFDLSRDELEATVTAMDLPRYRAGQLLRWVYERGVADAQAMTDLSRRDRALVAERIRFNGLAPIADQQASDGTRKLLLELPADQPGAGESQVSRAQSVECVMIPAESRDSGKPRRTACISSQVGCPVKCRFCASGLGGLEANLTGGQIVEQVWHLNRVCQQPITNIVFMGMGEPLSNFSAVSRAIRTLTADWGFGLSARRITLSTVGLPAQIRRLAELGIPITLALSLHAPNDELRRRLIPWADYVTIDQLLEAGRYYFQRTGREVTIEYTLIDQVNDQAEHAQQLTRLARKLRSNVNLIRYNEVASLPFGRPGDQAVRRFQQLLQQAGVNTHIRASRGRDIAAACGQLRHAVSADTSQPRSIG